LSGAGSHRLRAGRLESFAALAGGVTHELSNLAASVLMSVQLLEPRCAEGADRQVLASLDELARRIQHAGRQLHWLARGMAGAPTCFQPQYLLSDLQRLARAAFPASIVVLTRYPPELWPLAGDPLIVFQLLLALCLEARGHLPAGGTLVLAARNAEIGELQEPRARAARPGRYVVLEAAAEPPADAPGEPGTVPRRRAGRARPHDPTAAARRRKAAEARLAAAAAGGFTEPLPQDAPARGRRAYLPAAALDQAGLGPVPA